MLKLALATDAWGATGGTAPVVNLLTNTEDLTNASWTKQGSTVTANALVAPDGQTTMDKLVESATTDNHFTLGTASMIAGTRYTVSFYAKPAGRKRVSVYEATSTAARATWDTLAGTSIDLAGNGSPTQGTPIAAGSGIFRCSMELTAGVTGPTNFLFSILQDTDTGIPSYAGDGTSGLYLWGFQVNAGSLAAYKPN